MKRGPNKQHTKTHPLRYNTDRTWFSRLPLHTIRKWSGSILTTLEPAQGTNLMNILLPNKADHLRNAYQNCLVYDILG